MHESWNPIRGYLYQEPLNTLREKILPSISYQPKKENIFRVFQMPVNQINCVILGQDPYPTPGDAIGYAFINGTKKIPVSLRNIEKELISSVPEDVNPSKEIDMHSWVDQGVFLLNTALTVETSKAGSHLKYWEEFTKRVIQFISITNPTIWILWGKKAGAYQNYIMNNVLVNRYNSENFLDIPISPDINYVMTSPHPAAEAYAGGKAGFFGCNHFYKLNEILKLKRKNKLIY